MVLLPFAGGYNQDHQTIFRAGQVALRPHDKNFFVKKVVVYEGVHDLIWSAEPYTPNYFVEIDVERKIAGYQLHRSQVRGMRSPEMIRSHARVRGMMAGCQHAEGYMIQRWIA
jgi:LmbE family N-acetylglucosaminyl deacetylase